MEPIENIKKFDLFEFLEEFPWILNIFWSIVAIIIAIIIYILVTKVFFRRLGKKNYKIFQVGKADTYIKLLKSLNRYLFLIVMIFILLRINGVNISSAVTGVGIAGIIFGFAIQDALKDIIKGIDIITDSYYHVGDIIRVDKYTGKVIAIGIKTTKLEDIFEKNIVSISNRNIEKVEVLSHMINIDIPLPYELGLDEAESTIKYIVDRISRNENVENVEYRGVNEFAESSIKYQIKVYCEPIEKVQTRRDALTCILRCLEEKHIQVPFTQIDVHQIVE